GDGADHRLAQQPAQFRVERVHGRPRQAQCVDAVVLAVFDHGAGPWVEAAIIGAMRIPAILLLSALLPALSTTARADDCVPLVEAGWVRQPPMPMPMMAGFATIRNPCATAVAIVSASSPAFGAV